MWPCLQWCWWLLISHGQEKVVESAWLMFQSSFFGHKKWDPKQCLMYAISWYDLPVQINWTPPSKTRWFWLFRRSLHSLLLCTERSQLRWFGHPMKMLSWSLSFEVFQICPMKVRPVDWSRIQWWGQISQLTWEWLKVDGGGSLNEGGIGIFAKAVTHAIWFQINGRSRIK